MSCRNNFDCFEITHLRLVESSSVDRNKQIYKPVNLGGFFSPCDSAHLVDLFLPEKIAILENNSCIVVRWNSQTCLIDIGSPDNM